MSRHHSRHSFRLMRSLAQLALLGGLVGLACWPLNRIDVLQDRLLFALPAFSGGTWTTAGWLLALAPIPLVPLLLWFQQGPWRRGAGSGIPQVMLCLEDPHRGAQLLSAAPTGERLGLWTVASLALLPLGREGPVVEVGASLGQALLRRWPGLLHRASRGHLLAGAAGAGLAGGFNTPLMGVIFVVEELTGSFQQRLVWPALVLASAAALVSNLGGQPMYALGINASPVSELDQLLWAIPIGLGGGLLGGGFAWLLVRATALITPIARLRPLRLGLAVGLALSLLALLTGGASGGDGEALMRLVLDQDADTTLDWPWVALLAARLLGPVLALSTGIPGGLIDPAFALGGVFGAGVVRALAGDPHLGLALGMAAGLAGATQLPVMTIAFAIRLAGDQQLMPGLVAAAAIAAYTGHVIQGRPVYHALADLLMPEGSEGAAAVVEDEDHGRTGQGDQGQSTEVGDEMKVDTHGAIAGEGDDRQGV
ncbi:MULTISPECIES: chloride channel protein [unclassified Cyanobium]|uniref:chloride channel protein n=1 Tax=unclassified Cyanobium TaxID=2627006 RepID=UPI0020CB9D0B|nr:MULTISPECIES: chloride channel protein [unclassified Cyanobium]